MTLRLLVEKLARSDSKFITREELEGYCRRVGRDYLTAVKYLIRNKYAARIFKGVFYVYSIKERKLGASDMNIHEILSEALKIKGVTTWYFGLETALKYNNLTHESFAVEFVMNDKIFRAKPITILGRKVKFHLLAPKMLSFGLTDTTLKYSDPERTALDLLHLKHINKEEFDDITARMSRRTILRYAKNYPARIRNMVRP